MPRFARRYDWPTVYVLDRVLQPVGARCHIRRIDRQQHEAETYHLVRVPIMVKRERQFSLMQQCCNVSNPCKKKNVCQRVVVC
jgi:hypothetical protein